MALFGLFTRRETPSLNISTALDLVTYMASLVSNPDDIGTSLDTVRDITARLDPGESLSASDVDQLLGVYKQLEEYLTTKEPLRSFTKEELRRHIPEPLLNQLTDYETTAK
jgi:hypothetical protein